MGSKYLSSW